MNFKYNFLYAFIILFVFCSALYSSKLYYYAYGDIKNGFNITGEPLRVKPDSKIYAVSYEDTMGNKKRLTFYKNGKFVETKVFNESGKVEYVKGKSYYKKGAWFEIDYIYREKGVDAYKKLVKQIDYKIYKNRKKKPAHIFHREITYFILKKYNGKIWNIMKRRDFLPGNKLHHYWIFIYSNVESEKPKKILEYGINGKLLRKGKYKIIKGKEILIFEKM